MSEKETELHGFDKLRQVRIEKLEAIRESGHNPIHIVSTSRTMLSMRWTMSSN